MSTIGTASKRAVARDEELDHRGLRRLADIYHRAGGHSLGRPGGPARTKYVNDDYRVVDMHPGRNREHERVAEKSVGKVVERVGRRAPPFRSPNSAWSPGREPPSPWNRRGYWRERPQPRRRQGTTRMRPGHHQRPRLDRNARRGDRGVRQLQARRQPRPAPARHRRPASRSRHTARGRARRSCCSATDPRRPMELGSRRTYRARLGAAQRATPGHRGTARLGRCTRRVIAL